MLRTCRGDNWLLVSAGVVRWRSTIVCAVALTLLSGLGAAPAAAGNRCPGEGCVSVRPQDEVVLVSVRRIGCSTDATRFPEGMQALRYASADGAAPQWHESSVGEVIAATAPSMPTIVFVHGNRVEACEIRPRGLWVYRRLVACAGDERPFRFLIFSWPADQVKGMIKDARIKAARTKPAGYQLAWLVDQMPVETPLGLLGYSYGSRVISGASHLLDGGSLGQLCLSSVTGHADRPAEAVYVAPAFDADWLGRGGYHCRAMNLIDHLLVVTNRRDPAMRLYPVLNPDKFPQAMGHRGPTCLPREVQPRVRLMNVTSAVGRSHDMCEYMSVGGLMSNAWRRLTFADRPPAIEPRPAIASR